MPTLSTFAGASLRTYGRGIEQVPALLPAGTVLPFNVTDISTATIPSGWRTYTAANGRYILGTTINTEIGNTNSTPAGSATLTVTTSSDGNHSANASTSYTGRGVSGIFRDVRRSDSSSGAHTHTGAATVDTSGAMANTVGMPFITTDNTQTQIPQYAIIFRKVRPTSASYFDYRPDGNGVFYGSNQRVWTDRTGNGKGYGNVAVGGLHSHDASTVDSNSFFGSTQTDTGTTGFHTHNFQVDLNATLRSKSLKAWSSNQVEEIEYGMIVLYSGNLANIPAGWRLCDGTLGTPDMADYFLGYSAEELHDYILNSNNEVTVAGNVIVSTNSWVHNHAFSTHTNGNVNRQAWHSSLSVPHTHTATASFASVISAYMPLYTKLAFIQYKGI